MALGYGRKVWVDGCYGGIVRVVKNNKDKITHVDVEVSGVIERYSIDQVEVPKPQTSKHERAM